MCDKCSEDQKEIRKINQRIYNRHEDVNDRVNIAIKIAMFVLVLLCVTYFILGALGMIK